MRRIGVHTSIAGGLLKSLEKARELGCNTMQMFSHSPRIWAIKEHHADEAAAFKKLRRDLDISPAFIHTSYLINLATADPGLRQKSIDMVIREMNTADNLGAEYVVLHTGSDSHDNPRIARERAISCIREISGEGDWNAGLLLENTAGERGDTTSRIEDMAEIMDNVSTGLIAGICFDTCHAFSVGYDIRTDKGLAGTVRDIDNHIGKDRLLLIHLNDSKGALGSGIDRHEHIGEGKIGIQGFRKFLNHPFFMNVPLILETPKKTADDDPRNLKVTKYLISGDALK